MPVLLDTNICIHLPDRRPGFERVLRRLFGRSFGEIRISAIPSRTFEPESFVG